MTYTLETFALDAALTLTIPRMLPILYLIHLHRNAT